MLINPDAELVDGSLATLAADLLRPGAAEQLLAPLVLSPDGSRQDTAHLDPASPLLWVKALLPPVALPPPLRPLVDPGAPGAAAGGRLGRRLLPGGADRDAAPAGPFDERIFLFAEDLDLGLRAADAGIETVFRPDARVVHLDAHSTGPAFGGEPFELLARQRRAVIGDAAATRRPLRDDRIWR